jgi:hypothetical protein
MTQMLRPPVTTGESPASSPACHLGHMLVMVMIVTPSVTRRQEGGWNHGPKALISIPSQHTQALKAYRGSLLTSRHVLYVICTQPHTPRPLGMSPCIDCWLDARRHGKVCACVVCCPM